jgi:hypothetical protein
MRNKLILLWMLACSSAPAMAQVSVNYGFPSVQIGIHLNLFPELVPVPGYPVYYAPRLDANYFFYDGMYWVYQHDDWYISSWYNGPWSQVNREVVPVFILRIPVRYYRQAPNYFRRWQPNSAPRWGEHWGNEWQQRRHGWDKWDRHTRTVRPPLPVYQRNYSGNRYPQLQQQQTLQNKNYRYQPRDPLVRQQAEERRRHVTSMPTPIAPLPDQRKTHDSNAGNRDGRDQRRTNQRPAVSHGEPVSSDRREQQKLQAPAEHRTDRNKRDQATQNGQPERSRAPEQRQRSEAAQRTDNPMANKPVAQESNRKQRPEEQKDRRNERANDRDEERGQDRRK